MSRFLFFRYCTLGIVAALSVPVLPVHAVTPDFQWGFFSGGANTHYHCLDHNDQGYVFAAGLFMGTREFGRGAAAATMTAGPGAFPGFPGTDIFLTKSDTAGNLVWARQLGGVKGERIRVVAAAPDGGVVLGGIFNEDIVFGTGSQAPSLSSAGVSDIFLCRYDASGDLLWAVNWGGMNSSEGDEDVLGIAFDDSGNIITTGFFKGAVDFDPGAGNSTLINLGTSEGIYVSKFTPGGTHLWAVNAGNLNSVDGANGGQGNDLVTDDLGNIYVSGFFKGEMNFDMNGSGHYLTTINPVRQVWNAFLWKMDRNGSFIWAKPFSGVKDNMRNLSFVHTISIHNNTDLYLSGYFRDTVDFDPDPVKEYLVYGDSAQTDQGSSAFILKLDTSSAFKWVRHWGASSTNFTICWDHAVDPLGNIYATGEFHDTMDFDPGPGSFVLSPAQPDMSGFITRFDCEGNFTWAGNINAGTAWNYLRSVTVDAYSNVYVYGDVVFAAGNPVDLNPSKDTTLVNSDATQFAEAFLLKLYHCPSASAPEIVYGDTLICPGIVSVFSVPASCNAYSYTWELPEGMEGSSTSESVEIRATLPGLIRVRANGLCDTSAFTSLQVDLSIEKPEIDASGDQLSVTREYDSYQWLLSGVPEEGATGRAYEVTENGYYQVVVSDAGGCTDTSDTYLVTNVSVPDRESAGFKAFATPNPASHTVYIHAGAQMVTVLTDIGGRMLAARTGPGPIDLSGLEAGIYLLRITDGNGLHVRTEKLVRN